MPFCYHNTCNSNLPGLAVVVVVLLAVVVVTVDAVVVVVAFRLLL